VTVAKSACLLVAAKAVLTAGAMAA